MGGASRTALVILLAVAVVGISPNQAFGQDWGSGSRYTDYMLYKRGGYTYFKCTMAAMKWGNGRVDSITEERTTALRNAGLNMTALDNFQPPPPSPPLTAPDDAPIPVKLILRRVNVWITAIDVGIWTGVFAVAAYNKYKDYNRNKILGGIQADFQSAIADADQIMLDRTRGCAVAQNAEDYARDQGIIGTQADITVNYAIVRPIFWLHAPSRTVTPKVTVTCVAKC